MITSIVLAVLACLLLVPVATLAIECLMAFVRPRAGDIEAESTMSERAHRAAIVIPAHNEASLIRATITNLQREVSQSVRLLVVADNCTDATGQIAEESGAEVLRRNDTARHGKAYAMDAAVQHLKKNPPDVVIFLDADCALGDGTVRQLSNLAVATGRPVQARYDMSYEDDAPVNGFALLAWKVRGTARPIGLAALGMPCQLYGTGMAFPWPVLQWISLTSSSIVEDMSLTLQLACHGSLPLFCNQASVLSKFPVSEQAAVAQRRRWEHGHVAMIVMHGIPALLRAIAAGDLKRTILVLDVCIPPLSLLMTLLAIGVASCAVAFAYDATSPLVLAVFVAELVMVATAVTLSSRRFGRGILSSRDLLQLPRYLASKAVLYWQLITNRHKEWNRTDRL